MLAVTEFGKFCDLDIKMDVVTYECRSFQQRVSRNIP